MTNPEARKVIKRFDDEIMMIQEREGKLLEVEEIRGWDAYYKTGSVDLRDIERNRIRFFQELA